MSGRWRGNAGLGVVVGQVRRRRVDAAGVALRSGQKQGCLRVGETDHRVSLVKELVDCRSHHPQPANHSC